MKERLYNVKYLQLSAFSDAKTITEEMTQSELRDFLGRGMVTLLEVTQSIKDGSIKYRTGGSAKGEYNPEGKGYDVI